MGQRGWLGGEEYSRVCLLLSGEPWKGGEEEGARAEEPAAKSAAVGRLPHSTQNSPVSGRNLANGDPADSHLLLIRSPPFLLLLPSRPPFLSSCPVGEGMGCPVLGPHWFWQKTPSTTESPLSTISSCEKPSLYLLFL